MMLLLVLSALGAAMTTSGQTEIMVARNAVGAAQAHAAAESGLNHAVELMTANLQQFAANGFASSGDAVNSVLQGPDGLTGTAATDADNGSLEGLGIPRPPAQVALGAANGVSYEVRVFDDDDPARGTMMTAADLVRIGEDNNPTIDANLTLVLQAIGYATDNTRVTLEATLTNAATVLPAIVTGGDLVISGNPTLAGSSGGVHANADLDISGNPDISLNATASGVYTESGTPTIGGISGGGHATVPIPPVAAIDHKPLADFILNGTGQLTDQVGTVICDASADNAACRDAYGWEFDGSNGWKISGNSAADGSFYVEGDARVSGNPGSVADPVALTIIAEGSIEISGNPNLTPDTPELMFVSDGDMKISGLVEMPLIIEGAILAKEQLHLSGNPTLSGQIIVEDAADVHTLVTQSTISGNPLISYTGTLAGGAAGQFTPGAWREIR